MNLFDTPLASVGSTAKYQHTAHFPGTCPDPTAFCKSCVFFKDNKGGTGICGKWVQLRKAQGVKNSKATAISGDLRACKYFERNEAFKETKMGVKING